MQIVIINDTLVRVLFFSIRDMDVYRRKGKGTIGDMMERDWPEALGACIEAGDGKRF
jgi:hypothetical protein